MLDETRCEFGVTLEAATRDEAYDRLHEDYPESKCVQLESPEDTRKRQQAIDERARQELDGDFSQWEYEQEWGE
jgi:hypothetical protein